MKWVIGSILLAAVLVTAIWAARATRPAAPVPVPAVGPLQVQVLIKKTSARVGEELPAVFRVTNVSAGELTFQVMNCSWDDHWKSDNPGIAMGGWGCGKNFAVIEHLPPGQAYVRTASLFVAETAPLGTLKFRMGFQPIGAKDMVWSDELAITVHRGALEVSTMVGTLVGGVLVLGLLWWARRHRLEVISSPSRLGRIMRLSVLAAWVVAIIVLAASYWRFANFELNTANVRFARGSFLVWYPGWDKAFSWHMGPAFDERIWMENQYDSARPRFGGLALNKQDSSRWLAIVPLWIPTALWAGLIYMVWHGTRCKARGFPVEAGDGESTHG